MEFLEKGTYYALFNVKRGDNSIKTLFIAQGLPYLVDKICEIPVGHHAIEDFPYSILLIMSL